MSLTFLEVSCFVKDLQLIYHGTGIPGANGLIEQLERLPNAVIFLENIECANPNQVEILLEAFNGTLRNPLTGKEFRHCTGSIWLLATSLGEENVAAKADKLHWKKQDRFIQTMKSFLLERLHPDLGKRVEEFIPVLPSWILQRNWVTLKLQQLRQQIFQRYGYYLFCGLFFDNAHCA